jgi:glucose-1-phosphate thymidylyltransferase
MWQSLHCPAFFTMDGMHGGVILKGIILSAGRGTRMYPMTKPVCKPLLPIYDKPNIYYALSTLLLAQIREILVIVPEGEIKTFASLMGNGQQYGVRIEYIEQKVQRGIADAFRIGKDYIGSDSVCLILGDNIFYGPGFEIDLRKARSNTEGATIFGHYVEDPRPFGVVEFDEKGKVISLEEKPKIPKSHYIVPGLYFYDNRVVSIAEGLEPSARGELEITDVNKEYLRTGNLQVVPLGKHFHWFDTGNAESMFLASREIRELQHSTKRLIGCPEEIAYRNGYIDDSMLVRTAEDMIKTNYGKYLLKLSQAHM